MISTKLPNPIRKTRVLKLVFITIPCLKFWALYKLSISILYSTLSPIIFNEYARQLFVVFQLKRNYDILLKFNIVSMLQIVKKNLISIYIYRIDISIGWVTFFVQNSFKIFVTDVKIKKKFWDVKFLLQMLK